MPLTRITTQFISYPVSGSVANTSSWANNVNYTDVRNINSSSSFTGTASYAITSSYSTKSETLLSGANINAGQITASAISVTTLNVVTITSSIDYASGSNIFGNKSTDTQLFTGSVSITGSLTVNGPITGTASFATTYADSASVASRATTLETASGSFSTRVSNLVTDSGSFSTRITNLVSDSSSFSTRVSNLVNDSGSFSTRVTNLVNDSGSFSTRVTNLVSDSSSFSGRLTNFTGSVFGTASWATQSQTASYVLNAVSSSFAITASYASNVPATSSWSIQAQTASYVANAISASYALTASYASNVPATSSWSIQAQTASYVANAISASFASTASLSRTASFVSTLNQAVVISGSLTLTGSISFNSSNTGSVVLDINADTFEFSGSMLITGSMVMTGSIDVTGGLTGSLLGTASYATLSKTASFVSLAQTASYVTLAQSSSVSEYSKTASYVLNAISASFITTAQTASYVTLAQSASVSEFSKTASYVLNAITASYVANAQSASYVILSQTASFVTLAQTASFVQQAVSASYSNNSTSASYAVTSSYASTAGAIVSGINVSVNQLTASAIQVTNLNVITITSSIDYASGSNVFGTKSTDTQQFTGSVSITGSLTINGQITGTSSYSTIAGTASYSALAQTASYIANAVSASYALTASYASNVPATSSWSIQAQTASYVLNAISASYSGTASYALNGGGTSLITGSTYNITSSWANNVISSSFALTASYSSNVPATSSWSTQAQTASYVVTAITASYILNAVSSSFTQTASYIPWSRVDEGTTDTFLGTASYVLTAQTASFVTLAQTASYVINAQSASFASTASLSRTASFVSTLNQGVIISGSLALTGSISFNTSTTGSLVLDINADTFEFTGSMFISGSMTMTGSIGVTGGVTGSLLGTASYAAISGTSSYVVLAQTASFVTLAQTASFVTLAQTASYIVTAQTASYSLNSLYSASLASRTTILESASSSFSTRVTNLVTDSGSFSTRTATLETASGSFSTRVTNLVSDSSSFSARLSSYTGSIFGTASYATKAETLVSGININAGLITASAISVTTLNVVTITSSIEYSSGSSVFGTKTTDTQKFTGSVSITGSLTVNGTVTATSSYSSLAATASYFAGVTNGTTNYVAKFTSANVLGTSSIFDNGSVGIGTTSPAQKMEVTDSSSIAYSGTGRRVGSFLATAAAVADRPGISLGYDTSGAGIIAADTQATGQPIAFWTYNGSTWGERARISKEGNVGIGITSPSFKTEIQQGSSGATSALRTTPQLVLKGFGGSSTYHSGIGFSMYEHTNGYWGSGILEVDDTNSYGAALAFYTSTGAASASPSERVRISSTGAIIVSSTIGTTSSRPAVGTSRIAGEIAGAYTSLGSDGGFLRLSAGGGTGVGTKSYIDLSGYSTDAALETQIQLGTAGVPRMTINVSGNTGIGTTSPSAKLHVFNSTAVSAQAVTSGTNLIIESATSSYLEFRNTSDNGTNQGILFVDNNLGGYVGFTNAATDQMFIGGYAAVNLQVGTSNSFGGKTTIAAITSAGAAITGAITATGNITAYYSDDRLKTKLGKIENALEKICSLEGFYYEANDLAQSLGYKAVREVGISAQSVQSVLPEIVAPAPIDSKYLTIHYERTVPLIIEAIKELRNEIAALKK